MKPVVIPGVVVAALGGLTFGPDTEPFAPIIGAFRIGAGVQHLLRRNGGPAVGGAQMISETRGMPHEDVAVKLGLTHDPGPANPLAAPGH